MEPECYPSSALPHSSRLFLDYSESNTPLTPFYAHAAAGKDWIRAGRPLDSAHRTRLANLLRDQNQGFGAGPGALANIDRLRDGASAVVTGQQVALFGGPLYTLLKAATAIARAREATEAGIDTVPIFWLASEDHDFAEVAKVRLAAPDGTLSTVELAPAPMHPVPVGAVALGQGITSALAQAEALLGPGFVSSLLHELYRPEATLAGAFAGLFARLFAPWGLVVIDPASRGFHELGAPILEAALTRADELHATLLERERELLARGYHAQVLVAESSSLLFLIDALTRARQPLRRTAIPNEWKAGSHRYTTDELLAILKAAPERFSPNALLRPVFQDAVLPTSAYVGGPAEIAYFAQSAVLYSKLLGRETAILPRLSATLLTQKVQASMERFAVSFPDALTAPDALAERLGARTLPVEGKRLLANAGNALDQELTGLTGWMGSLDEGLGRSANTAASKMRYQMNRLRRMAARHQLERESSLSRHAAAIVNTIYPGGHLQERTVAGASLLATHGDALLETFVHAAEDSCPGHKVLTV